MAQADAVAAQDSMPVPPEFGEALHELGLVGDEALTGSPLTGGVSSDIWRIDTARGPVCAKRALSKLRVAADWRAPIERNAYEARWMEVADQASPGCTPAMLGQHPRLGVLVMGYLPADRYRLWKEALRDGHAVVEEARAVGRVLARIHAYSAARPALAERFDTDAIFYDIRLEPYLVATGTRHPDLAPRLQALVQQTQANAVALVHGDVSPKNILLGAEGPVLLDAECAWWGDPAFDVAFCLNHLLLKCLWNPPATDAFLACFDAFVESYFAGVDWEPREVLERRVAHLLPGLFLARVDGKSPAEYLRDEAQKARVRTMSRRWLQHPVDRLSSIRAAWREELAS